MDKISAGIGSAPLGFISNYDEMKTHHPKASGWCAGVQIKEGISRMTEIPKMSRLVASVIRNSLRK